MNALLEYYVSGVLLKKMTVTHLVSKFPTLYETVTYTDIQKSPPKNRVLKAMNQVHLLKPYFLRLI
jgi:hypothetical protein